MQFVDQSTEFEASSETIVEPETLAENSINPDSDVQASDTQASDTQASDDQASDNQASDNQASDIQASDIQASDIQASDTQASDIQASDIQASDIQASDNQASDNQASDIQASDNQASDNQASDNQASDIQASDNQASDTQASDIQASDIQASDDQASDDQAAAPEDNQGTESAELSDKSPFSDNRCEFGQLGLNDLLTSHLVQMGFTEPTPIQSATIPQMLLGKDVLGQAQTGTGKTAAFALPILNQLKFKKSKPQCLVLAPTRELAIQVGEAFESFGSKMGKLKVATICGGQDYNKQIRQLKRGAQVVVGTPGRVIDLVKKSELKLEELDWTVLDEADEMLRMGFEEDVKWILSQTSKRVSMALFSATLPHKIQEIAQQYLKDPVEISIKQKTSTAETIDQKYIIAKGHQKKEALARILEGEQTDGVMVFVKTRSITEPLAEFISARLGYSVAAINGDIPQARREQIIDNLKSGKIDIIVATDVAARGLDVDRISHVINYDLPQDIEGYIHRIGRTGRAGRRGCSVLFLQPNEKNVLDRIVQSTKQKIDLIELPNNRQVNQARVQRFHEAIVENLQNPELEKYQSVIAQLMRDNEIPLEIVAASLAVMANEGKTFFQQNELKLPEFANRSSRGEKDGKRSGGRSNFERSQNSGRFGNRKSGNLKSYRIEIGRKHRVKPGNIVGAIANEAGIGNESIGQIKIFDSFSVIDLPANLTGDQLEHLGKVSIGKRNLRIKEDQRPPRSKERFNRRDRNDKRSSKR